MNILIHPHFPKIPLDALLPFLEPSETVDYLSRIRAVRDWLRQQLKDHSSE